MPNSDSEAGLDLLDANNGGIVVLATFGDLRAGQGLLDEGDHGDLVGGRVM